MTPPSAPGAHEAPGRGVDLTESPRPATEMAAWPPGSFRTLIAEKAPSGAPEGHRHWSFWMRQCRTDGTVSRNASWGAPTGKGGTFR